MRNWSGIDSTIFDLEKAEKEMRQAWRLKGNLSLANLGEKKLLLEFNSKGEAWWVLQKGERKFSFFRIDLRRWKFDEGCSPISKTPQVWVRLFGLPVFVWEEKNLKKLGDACRGFIAVDNCTRAFSELHWAYLPVRADGKKFLQVLIIKMEGKSWKIRLWWELPPVCSTTSARDPLFFNKARQREEEEETTRAVECVIEGLGGLTIEMISWE